MIEAVPRSTNHCGFSTAVSKIALINRVQISTFCNLNAKEKNQYAGEKTGKLRWKNIDHGRSAKRQTSNLKLRTWSQTFFTTGIPSSKFFFLVSKTCSPG